MITRREALAAFAFAPGKPKYPIIDSHVHVWKRDPRYPWAKETTRPPEKDATPEMLLALMRANGVARTVIIQVIYYRWDNSYLANVLREYPRYFRGVARVNPESPHAPDDLARLVEEQGFRGVRLSPAEDASGDWIRGPLMPPLWKRCRELKVPMTILAGINRMPDIAALAEKFPDLTIVIDHMADCPADRPDLLKKLVALTRYPLVFVKVSHTWTVSKQPYPYRDAQEQVKRLYDAFGPKRLMWGTDWPLVENYCGYAKALAMVRDEMKFLSEEDKSWMLNRTIERVWPFG
ncbi:MAG TPA: amidohydrolase family protein [Bryobacteraceae bacterium]|nr:amidohydrolase family protein [Bryobacteraceae bacterium]